MDFPGGRVVSNPSANTGETGLIPGPGRSHMLPQATASEPVLCNKRKPACSNEDPAQPKKKLKKIKKNKKQYKLPIQFRIDSNIGISANRHSWKFHPYLCKFLWEVCSHHWKPHIPRKSEKGLEPSIIGD